MTRDSIRNSVLAALFAALITVGAYIAIPLPFSPVPIVLQNLFVLLAGLLLSWKWAAAAVGLYLILGVLGLPVFSAARGGLAHILGPTGGYLVGFLLAAVACSLVAGGEPQQDGPPMRAVPRRGALTRDVTGVVTGTAVIYVCGVPWLWHIADMSWPAAFSAGLLPFLPGDALKAAAAVAIARAARPLILRHAASGD